MPSKVLDKGLTRRQMVSLSAKGLLAACLTGCNINFFELPGDDPPSNPIIPPVNPPVVSWGTGVPGYETPQDFIDKLDLYGFRKDIDTAFNEGFWIETLPNPPILSGTHHIYGRNWRYENHGFTDENPLAPGTFTFSNQTPDRYLNLSYTQPGVQWGQGPGKIIICGTDKTYFSIYSILDVADSASSTTAGFVFSGAVASDVIYFRYLFKPIEHHYGTKLASTFGKGTLETRVRASQLIGPNPKSGLVQAA